MKEQIEKFYEALATLGYKMSSLGHFTYKIFFLALSPSQIKAITYATTKELEEETNITNGNHVLNGIDPDDDSEENHNPNSSSSNATAGESRPGSYR